MFDKGAKPREGEALLQIVSYWYHVLHQEQAKFVIGRVSIKDWTAEARPGTVGLG